MTLKRPKGDPGTLVVLEHHSRILKGNPLGDNVPERAARPSASALPSTPRPEKLSPSAGDNGAGTILLI